MESEGREYITPEIERRQYRRVNLVTQIRCEALSREELLVTRDVGVGGLFINSKKVLPLGSEVSLSFRLQPNDPLISCRGKVVCSKGDLGMGIQFLDLGEESRQLLQKFVDESL